MGGAGFDAGAEFDRQVRVLVELGYPAVAGLDEEGFRALVAPLRERAASVGGVCDPEAGQVPFVLVLTREVKEVGEQTRVRVAWDGPADDQTGFKVLGALDVLTR